MITVSHPTVNQYVRALVSALDRRGALLNFHTTFAIGRRSVAIAKDKLRQHPYREALRLLGKRLHLHWLIRHEIGWASVDSVAREFDRCVAQELGNNEAVYCYEDSAFFTFHAAERIGMRRYYELPILYWKTARKLLQEEAERYPEWEPTLLATRDSTEKLERKSAEILLADLVVCPSRQVQRSLPTGIRSLVAEYGCPTPIEERPPRNTSHLRILFAGAMTQRKGLADLFSAMKQLKRSDVELVILGSPVVSPEFYRKIYPHFRHEPPRSHQQAKRLMLECDILVLPSIVEGRAMVQMEALSCGLPIIVTPNAGAEDLVEPGRTGFLIPIRAPEKLAETVDWIADHRAWINDVHALVLQKARQSSWDGYTGKVLEAVL